MRFKVGDVVVLKSGSEKMTIKSISEDRKFIECIWFFNGQLLNGLFNRETIKFFNEADEN